MNNNVKCYRIFDSKEISRLIYDELIRLGLKPKGKKFDEIRIENNINIDCTFKNNLTNNVFIAYEVKEFQEVK